MPVEAQTAATDLAAPRGFIRTRLRLILVIAVVLILAATAATIVFGRNTGSELTGIVTTNDVIVSPMIAGQVERLLVHEGDHVARNQLVAVLAPDELRADRTYYSSTAAGSASEVTGNRATLRFQEQQTHNAIRQQESQLAAAIAQRAEATANATLARTTLARETALLQAGAVSPADVDQVRTNSDVAQARLEAATRQVAAQQSALALAQSTEEQVSVRQSALMTAEQQRIANAAAANKADIRLGYTELRAPIDGTVDVAAVRTGEVVNAGQPIVTLVNPDDLWVRADVEEGDITRIRLGDRFTVRLPSGATRQGVVFYRGIDADFATQRDVSRSKRDIRTFEIRLRVPNADRALAVGMTAYVLIPAARR